MCFLEHCSEFVLLFVNLCMHVEWNICIFFHFFCGMTRKKGIKCSKCSNRPETLFANPRSKIHTFCIRSGTSSRISNTTLLFFSCSISSVFACCQEQCAASFILIIFSFKRQWHVFELKLWLRRLKFSILARNNMWQPNASDWELEETACQR